MKPIFFWSRVPLNQRDKLPKGPGLYAVVSLGKVFYVGLSEGLRDRWRGKHHHRLPQAQDLLFPYLHYIELPESKISAAEKRLIDRVKPPWNNTKVPKYRWSFGELLSVAVIMFLVVVLWERWGDLLLELLGSFGIDENRLQRG